MNEHSRERDVVRHSASNQHECSAQKQARIEGEFPSNYIGRKPPDCSPDEKANLGGQRNASNVLARIPELLRSGWLGDGLTDDQEL